MDWLYYLLEANLYLIIFYGFYRLLLQNQTFYNSNRYFLLASSIMAFVLPILQIGYLKPAPPQVLEQVIYTELPPVQPSLGLSDYLYFAYVVIAIGFAIKLLLATGKIIGLWLGAKKHRNKSFTLVELQDEKEAFSFFNLLFIHPQMAEKQVVLKHELVHIKQKHSVDVLFFELLQIVCWFNPIIYFIKRDVKLLHEYIADELSASTNQQKHDYVMFLIENSFGIVPQQLTNHIFNQSILKRRINMLNKKRTTNWARLKLLLALPLGSAMLCTSTMAFTKDYGYVDLFPEKNNATTLPVQEVIKVENVKKQDPKVENVKRGEVKVENIKKAKKDEVRFPPPKVRLDKHSRPAPPAIEPAPAKKDQVRFPPPIVKPDRAPGEPKEVVKFPPPRVRPAKKAKADQVKFPPPTVKEEKKEGNNDQSTTKAYTEALENVTISDKKPTNGLTEVVIVPASEKISYSMAGKQAKSNGKELRLVAKDAYQASEKEYISISDKSAAPKPQSITVKPSTKESKKDLKPVVLELLPTKKQP